MKSFRSILFSIFAAMAVHSAYVHAEDIDIYVDNAGTSGAPNVLFVIDNGANFSNSAPASCQYADSKTDPLMGGTSGGFIQCSLYNALYSLDLTKTSVNVGFMVGNGNINDINGKSCSGYGGNNAGGCLVSELKPVTADTRPDMLAWLRKWCTGDTCKLESGTFEMKGNGTKTGASMQEAWAYYAGKTGLSGRKYSKSNLVEGCQKNFVIYIGDAFRNTGTPQDNGNPNHESELLTAGAASPIKITPLISASYGTKDFSCGSYVYKDSSHTSSSGLYADEWAEFMKGTDISTTYSEAQNITTYTIGLLGPTCTPEYPALLTSMAKMGGGKYFATSNYDELKVALGKILNEVQAVNSVFSSATLPVSVNAQGTYLNQIFLGMFRPDPQANPRWIGNLKQYQFVLDYLDPTKPDPNTAKLKLGDAKGKLAISSSDTGFIAPDAISYWTEKDTELPISIPDSLGGFFWQDPKGAGVGFDLPDGEFVEKGGAAQQIRKKNLTSAYPAAGASNPTGSRKVYTYCGPSDKVLSNSSNSFSVSNTSCISDSDLNATDPVSITITRAATTASAVASGGHKFENNNSVTISGANQTEYNGTFTVTKIDDSSFSFQVADYPFSPAQGTYVASKPSSGARKVSSLVRSGETVTVTTADPHSFSSGQTITVTGADQSAYNVSVTLSNPDIINAIQFKYTVAETPATKAGSGTATVGANQVAIVSATTGANPGVQRTAGSTTVTVSVQTASTFLVAGANVTLKNVIDATGQEVVKYNKEFKIESVAGSKKSFTFKIPATDLEPTTPATGSNILADNAILKAVSGITRSGNMATVTTSAAHGFIDGEMISIGGTAGTNEAAYIGTHKITYISTTQFSYQVVQTPALTATGAIKAVKIGDSDRVSLINWVRGEDN